MTITTIPPSIRRRLPTIRLGDDLHPFPVDRIGIVYVGRRWQIAEPPDRLQIELAESWLDEAQAIATPSVGSYAMKHLAERWSRQYLSNGAFLIAAYRAGFAMQWTFRLGPNCKIGVSKRWLRDRPESLDAYRRAGDARGFSQRFGSRSIPSLSSTQCAPAMSLIG